MAKKIWLQRIVMLAAAAALTFGMLSCGQPAGSGTVTGSEEGETEGHGGEHGGGDQTGATGAFVVFSWNDLGMHCLNPSYDAAVILPPYNTVYAQVVQKGNPPKVVTAGLTVEYRLLNNTYSYGKTDSFGGKFAQFWDNVQKLFGVQLERDKGLNLDDPNIHNGLSGSMVPKGDYFIASGIPLTPVDDSGNWNPYQVAEITVKDASGKVLAQTKTTVPTSDEINCAKCHGNDAFNDILQKHDKLHGTDLVSQKPVLCSSCHGSPVLGQKGPGSSGKYLSLAVHKAHAPRGAACYDCHPGNQTQCNRSLAHTAADGNCTTCHGSMANVASSIQNGRTPWQNEPKCATCHTGVPGVDTGSQLYRNARGHGDLFCAACHGSPHAMIPTRLASDNYQAKQYQGKAVAIGSCKACHHSNHGKGLGEFLEEHGPGDEHKSACNVCHTEVTTVNTDQWPHKFQWKARN